MQILYIISILLLGIAQAQNQCCLKIQGRSCLNCPPGTHLYRGNCLIDIDNCQSYKDGFDCLQCNTGFQLNNTGDCMPIPPPINNTTTAP